MGVFKFNKRNRSTIQTPPSNFVAMFGDIITGAITIKDDQGFFYELGSSPTTYWQNAVLDLLNTPPALPANADTYLVDNSPNGVWTGHANQKAIWDSIDAIWKFTTLYEGTRVIVINQANSLYKLTNLSWIIDGITGMLNYIPKFTATGTTNSLLYDDGVNVGIGTITPTQKLDVSGNILSTGYLLNFSASFQTGLSSLGGYFVGSGNVLDLNTATQYASTYYDNTTGNIQHKVLIGTQYSSINQLGNIITLYSDNNSGISGGGSVILQENVLSTNNLSVCIDISTFLFGEKLRVNGTILTNNSGYIIQDANTIDFWQLKSPSNRVFSIGAQGLGDPFTIDVNSTSIWTHAAYNVGIGTSTPSAPLHVYNVNGGTVFLAKFESIYDARILVHSLNSSSAQITALSEGGTSTINLYSFNSSTAPFTSGGSTINFYKYEPGPGLINPGQIYYDIADTKFKIQSNDGYSLSLNTASVERLNISNTGLISINNLVGTGTRILTVDTTGTLISGILTSDLILGSGVSNYVPKWSNSNTLTNSSIFDNGTNIGIGTSAPTTKFNVIGLTLLQSSMGGDMLELVKSNGQYMMAFRDSDTVDFFVGGVVNTTLRFGRLGINVGNINPTSMLQIKGDVAITNVVQIEDSTDTSLLYIKNDGTTQFQNGFKILAGATSASVNGLFPIFSGFGGSFEASYFGASISVNTPYVDFGNSGNTRISAASGVMTYHATSLHTFDNFVGIGTVTPTAMLQIDRASNGVGLYVKSAYSNNLDATIKIVGENTPSISFSSLLAGFTNWSLLKGYNNGNDFEILYSSALDGIPNTTAITIKGLSGNIGLGTSTPTEKLTVNGDTLITGLSGIGIRNVAVDASGKLISAPITGGTVNKYSTTFTPGTINVANTITHALGTTDIIVQLWDISSGEEIMAKLSNKTSNTVDVSFTANPVGDVRIVIIG